MISFNKMPKAMKTKQKKEKISCSEEKAQKVGVTERRKDYKEFIVTYKREVGIVAHFPHRTAILIGKISIFANDADSALQEFLITHNVFGIVYSATVEEPPEQEIPDF